MYKGNNNRLKELTEYIETNLTEKIEYKKLAQILLVNEYTLHRIFYFVTNISLAEYIRKRRLSMAAIDLLEGKDKIMDIAIKYQYDSATAFARAFKKMMGFTPKEIHKNEKKITYFPVLKFDDITEETEEITFQKLENISFELYTIHKETNMQEFAKVAQDFWKEIIKDKSVVFGEKSYGIAEYDKDFYDSNSKATYYIGSTKKFPESKKYTIQNKKFLVFQIDTIEGKKVNQFTKDIYTNVIPNLGYNLDNIPDIEEYINDEITKLYIPII